MPSDPGPLPSIAPEPAQGPAASRSRGGAAGRFERERNRRKIAILAALLVLLAMLAYSAYYFAVHKKLPIEGLAAPEAALAPPEYLFSISGKGGTEMARPLGVGYSDGRVYVVDFDKRVIRVYDRAGRHMFDFNQIEGGTLRNPVHLAIDSRGRVWVSDRRLKGLYVFDREGEFLFEFGPDGDAGFEWTPLAVAFDPQDRLIVTDVDDTLKHQVFVFDRDGKKLAQFGRSVQVANADESPGGFFFPNGAAGVDGKVYISDGDNRRMQVFDTKGAFQYFIDTSGIPRGAAIDEEKRVYVVDAVAHQVDVYDVKGERLTQFGEQGFGPGQFNYPNDVAVDTTGRIYISDRENNQVQVWQWPVEEGVVLPRPRAWWQWSLCASPLLLLLIPLLRRRRKYALTEDFVDELVARGKVAAMDERKLVWLVPEAEHVRYQDRVEDGIDLGDIIRGEVHSPSDAADIAEKLEVDEPTSILLAIAKRAKRLCTEDADLRALAVLLDIDVLNAEEFLAQQRESGGTTDAPPSEPPAAGPSGSEPSDAESTPEPPADESPSD